MSVYDDLAQILSARYGKDVRQSIHDAIEQCYSDATGNPESVAAFADDILDLQAADTNINTTIGNMQTTINGLLTTVNSLQTTINGQFNKFFPIGSLYVTGDDTFNPNTAEGWQGTWAKIQGRFILGSSNDYEVNSVGGEATHTLTVDEMPSHSHTGTTGTGHSDFMRIVSQAGISHPGNSAIGYTSSAYEDITDTSDFPSANHYHTFTTDSTGEGQAHNNMPPYEVKHIWERTA